MPNNQNPDQAADILTPHQLDELRAALRDKGFPEAAIELVIYQVSQTEPDWAYCPKCHQKVKADFIDRKAINDGLKLIVDHVVGKPSERKQVDVNVLVTRKREELESLTDAELLQIADGEIVEEEWPALPPAA